MNIAQIKIKLKEIVKKIDREQFIFELIRAYNTPKASISRLQNGNLNISCIPGEISWRKKLLFKEVKEEFPYELIVTVNNLKPIIRFAEGLKNDVILEVDGVIKLDFSQQ